MLVYQRVHIITTGFSQAYTCFTLLLLPRYSSGELLRDRLLAAITETEVPGAFDRWMTTGNSMGGS